MSRRWRGLALCLAIVLLFGLGLLAASRSGPVRRLVQARTEAVLTRALGREVRLAGARLNLPAAALTLQSFRVAERSAGLTRFTAEAVRIRWRWLPLLRRQLDIQDVTLVRPRIAVAPTAATPPPRELLALPLRLPAVRLGQWTLAIRHARIQDGDVEWALPGGPAGRLASVQGSVVWSAGLPVAALEAAGLSVRIGEATRQFDRLRLEAAWSPSTVAVRRLEFAGSRGRVQAQGRVLSVTEAPQYDLEVGVQAPLAALLSVAGWPQAAEGAIELTGRLAGPLEAPTFQGDARVAVPDSPPIAPVRLAGHWQAGRLEVAAMGGPEAAPQSVQLRASFTPATALYQLRLQADGTELASLGAWPATGLALAGVAVPGPLTGLVTADVDLSGRLHDLATLRGQARLRVDGLGLAGQPAAGRLEARFATTTQALTVERAELLLPRGRFAAKGSLEFATGHLHFPIQADVQDVAPVARAFGLRLLGGRLTFGGVLAGSRDAPRLGGRLAWREARFGSRALDRIEGKVEVAGRRLNSSGLLVQVGRTRGTVRGSVEAAGQASIRFLDFGRDLRLDVRGELRPARTADLVDFLPDGLEIQGEGQASGRLAGSPRGLRGEITIRMENPRVWKERFRRGEALVSLDPTGVRVSQLVLQRGAEQIRGEVTVRQDTLSGRLDTTVMDLAGLHWLAESGLAGRGALQIELSGMTAAPEYRGRASLDELRFRRARVGPARATFRVAKTVEVDLAMAGARLRLGIGEPAGTLRADLTLDDGDLDPYLRLSDLEDDVLPSTIRATGQVSLHGRTGELALGEGQADLARLRFTARGEAWESRTPVRASWRGGVLTLPAVRLRSGEREVTVQGTLNREQADLRVQGELPLVALPVFRPGLTAQAGLARVDLAVRGPIRSPELRGPVSIEAGVLRLSAIPAPLEEVSAGLDLQGDRTFIRSWQGRLAGGAVRGAGELRRTSTGWEVASSFRLEDGQASGLLGPLRGKGEVTGRVSLNGSLRMRGATPADLWQGLNGEVGLAMRDGELGRNSLLARLLSLLNVWQLLDLRLTAAGMPYRELTADFRIRDGVARTENLVLESPAMKVNAVGDVSLADEQVDLEVAVKPFQALDRVLTPIPIAGWLLGGREKGVIVASYHVSGPLRDPEITPLPLKNVGRNVFGIFQRILELPEALTAPFRTAPQPAPPESGR